VQSGQLRDIEDRFRDGGRRMIMSVELDRVAEAVDDCFAIAEPCAASSICIDGKAYLFGGFAAHTSIRPIWATALMQ
jgi:hypothetical protein